MELLQSSTKPLKWFSWTFLYPLLQRSWKGGILASRRPSACQDKTDAISQTTFSSAFSSMKMFEFRLKFHWNLFLRVQLTIVQSLVQIMVWRWSGDRPLSEPMMVGLLTHICVTLPQWVNALLYQLTHHGSALIFFFQMNNLPLWC